MTTILYYTILNFPKTEAEEKYNAG